MLRILLLLSLVFLSFTPHNADANTRMLREAYMWEQQVKKAQNQYKKSLNMLYTAPGSMRNKVVRLRSVYPMTRQYTPFSNKIKDQMTHYAYIADTSTNSETKNDALFQYEQLVKSHIVNLDILKYAITLSKANIIFGNPEFYQGVYESLKDIIIMTQRDGLSPNRSHRIITYGEENFILQQIGGTIKKTEMFEVGKVYYNVHDLMTNNNKIVKIFVDISIPMKRIKKDKKLRDQERKGLIPKMH